MQAFCRFRSVAFRVQVISRSVGATGLNCCAGKAVVLFFIISVLNGVPERFVKTESGQLPINFEDLPQKQEPEVGQEQVSYTRNKQRSKKGHARLRFPTTSRVRCSRPKAYE